MDHKKPVLGGPVRSPQYLGRSLTGCGPRLPVLGAKNRTEPDLRTLGIDAEFDDGLNIKEVTTQAFSLLGEDGIIRASEGHACAECTQKHKDMSDVVFNNPAAVVGVDATDDDIPALAEAP